LTISIWKKLNFYILLSQKILSKFFFCQLLESSWARINWIRAVDLLPKVSSKWLSSNRILSSSPPLLIYTFLRSILGKVFVKDILLYIHSFILCLSAHTSWMVFWWKPTTFISQICGTKKCCFCHKIIYRRRKSKKLLCRDC
jgi:hypothetical protein